MKIINERGCLAKVQQTFGSILDLDKIRCYFKEKRVTNPLEPLSHQGFFRFRNHIINNIQKDGGKASGDDSVCGQ